MVARFRMGEPLQELSGATTVWIVGVELDLVSGWTLWGGNDPDRFLTVDDRLVLAPTVEALLDRLPTAGRHSFHGDERYLAFRRDVRRCYPPRATGGDESGLFDFAATRRAIREREVLYAPHSGMAADCLGAALDLGRQYGEDSVGYRVARFGPLDRLYRALWGELDEADLDHVEIEAAFTCLVDWIEARTRPGRGRLSGR
ncbi:hypothetical protein [Micromonospora auratinigra]|uniref:Uncharacterized protein n=1 Tax=Micromonospora auratinigra TaxID=261654 RepID=A0A1A8ZJ42_9ACTN|nr:hypothetical protein [Micromonospora auratinigra]SBT43886.1 hypothetical protein GA0070611_2493 [Micromonospora auratinigra]